MIILTKIFCPVVIKKIGQKYKSKKINQPRNNP